MRAYSACSRIIVKNERFIYYDSESKKIDSIIDENMFQSHYNSYMYFFLHIELKSSKAIT